MDVPALTNRKRCKCEWGKKKPTRHNTINVKISWKDKINLVNMWCSYTTFLIDHPGTRPECIRVPNSCYKYPERAWDKSGVIAKWMLTGLCHGMSWSYDTCQAVWYSCLSSGGDVVACCIVTMDSAAALHCVQWCWYTFLLIWPAASVRHKGECWPELTGMNCITRRVLKAMLQLYHVSVMCVYRVTHCTSSHWSQLSVEVEDFLGLEWVGAGDETVRFSFPFKDTHVGVGCGTGISIVLTCLVGRGTGDVK